MDMTFFLNALVAYFVIIDPVGLALVFNALTRGRDTASIRKTAYRAVAVSFAIVLFFGFFGLDLLNALGIEMDAFKIAGGLLLFYAAFHMIIKPERSVKPEEVEQEDIAVFPLAIPLISGPGCLTLTVLLFSSAREHGGRTMTLLAAVLLSYLLTLLALLIARPLTRLIGNTGNSVLQRLLGVLLASLSIQFIVDGIKGMTG